MLTASDVYVTEAEQPPNHRSVSVSVDLSQGNEHDTSVACFVKNRRVGHLGV